MSINYSSNVLMAKVAVNKSLLKEYNNSDQNERVVYLNNGDDFQIQLFNPERTTIGAEVYVNGEKLSGILVLKPGERIWLERFTDRAVKFKFSTYNVEDGYSEEVQNAIADNGVITVKFFKEKKKNYWWYDNNGTSNNINVSDLVNDLVYTTSSDVIKCRNDINTANSVVVNSAMNNLLKPESTYSKDYTCKFTSEADSIDNLVYTTSYGSSMNEKSFKYSYGNLNLSNNAETRNTIETGRISEGGYSSQKFNNVNIYFEYYPFRTEVIKILPVSRKPYNSSDLNKIYCTECGRKLNPKYKFCPYCGTRCD